MDIVRVSQVAALVKTTDAPQGKETELEMLATGEIILPDLKPDESVELFVVYEGSYTEFDYRVRPLAYLPKTCRSLTCNRSRQPLPTAWIIQTTSLFLQIMSKLQCLCSLQNQLSLERLGKQDFCLSVSVCMLEQH